MPDDSESLSRLHDNGLQVSYLVIALVLQSLFYGIQLLLIPLGLQKLMKRKGNAQRNTLIMLAMLVPSLLSSVFWALRLAEILVNIRNFFLEPADQVARELTRYVTLFNAIILVNFVVSDGVVVWRAWVLCEDEFRNSLLVPCFFLTLTALSITSTIGVRIFSYFTTAGPSSNSSMTPIKAVIAWLQVSSFMSSLLTNVSATSVVSLKAWRHRQVLRAGLRDNTKTRGEQILYLLIESGFLYFISGAILLAFSVIKLPHGTIGDIYMPMCVQVAGIYPTIVVVLIDLQQSRDSPLQWQFTLPHVNDPCRNVTTIAGQTTSGQSQ